MDRTGEQLKAEMFSPFLISEKLEQLAEYERSSLVSDYIAWTAPSLLTLQNLGEIELDRLESHLNVQAISIEHHWKLYPETLDEKKLTAARVQCRLQKANR